MFHLPAKDICYAHLRGAILSGALRGGDRILTEAVAAELGLSRMPVREALRQLDAEGLVVIRPNRGAIVASPSVDELSELLEMRAVLEGLAARHAAGRLGAADIDELDALVAGMRRASADPNRWVVQHERFHDALLDLSGRPRLAAEVRRLRARLLPYIQAYARSQPEPETLGHEHEVIVDALRDRDAARAERQVAAHAVANARSILALLAERAPARTVAVG
jgi:DNA-binding GntR family transcriptional regulator